jgi:hypothetical protein
MILLLILSYLHFMTSLWKYTIRYFQEFHFDITEKNLL